MKLHKEIDISNFKSLISNIKKEIQEWRAIDFTLEKNDETVSIFPLAHRVENFFGHGMPGDMFLCGKNEVLALVRMGKNPDFIKIKNNLLEEIRDYGCGVIEGSVTEQGLEVIEQRISSVYHAGNSNIEEFFFNERFSRKANKFFVIDDSKFVRKFLCQSLEGLGEVFEFEDTEGVVEAYLKELPDVVFTDINMPGQMNGLELTEKIKAYDPRAHVIIQSSDTNKDNVLRARNIGAKAFLAKPFTNTKVLECIMRCSTIKQ